MHSTFSNILMLPPDGDQINLSSTRHRGREITKLKKNDRSGNHLRPSMDPGLKIVFRLFFQIILSMMTALLALMRDDPPVIGIPTVVPFSHPGGEIHIT